MNILRNYLGLLYSDYLRLCAKKLKTIMKAAYNELLETDITTTPPIHINTPKKVKSPIAKEIQKLRKSGSSDSEIIEYLLDTDGLTELVTPKSNEQEIR